jgi:copper chaperone CopZ
MAKLVVDVSGMTCNHCVQSVTTAVEALENVQSVDIELAPQGNSRVTITHDGAELGDVASAVSAEGYTLEAVAEQS